MKRTVKKTKTKWEYTEAQKKWRRERYQRMKEAGEITSTSVDDLEDEYDFTEEERVRIMEAAPDYIQTASKLMQDRYVDLMAYEEKMEEVAKEALFTFENKNGKLVTVDLLKTVAFKNEIRKNLGSEQDIIDATEIKSYIVSKHLTKLSRKKRKLQKSFAEERRGVGATSPEMMDRIILLLSTYHSIKDIQKIILEEFGFSLTNANVAKIYLNNKASIEEDKLNYLSRSKQYRVATEAGRLDILNDLLTDLQLKYKRFVEKDDYPKIVTFEREIRNVLEQARKEVKGNEITLTVDGKIDINATLHGQENIARAMRSLPINAIVIGIVAAKSGLKPEVLIGQLASSYYKDFNGFNKNILGRDKIMLPGDLIRSYDWNEIAENNKRFLNEMQPIEIQEAEEVKEIEGQQKKMTLKEKIEELKRKKV